MGIKQYGGNRIKMLKKCTIIILAIFIFFLIILSLPWLIMLGISIFAPNPPVPEITYAEFPFELEYEINGHITKVKDVVICKYDKKKNDILRVIKYPFKWKKWLLASGEEDLLLLSEGNKKIFCTVGNANYYMGEIQEDETPKPKLYIDECEGTITTSSSNPVELEKYNVRIIHYEFSQPIENIFR